MSLIAMVLAVINLAAVVIFSCILRYEGHAPVVLIFATVVNSLAFGYWVRGLAEQALQADEAEESKS